MTGFGAARVRLGARSRGSISVEVKSVNQRFLDLKLSLPKEYALWEGDLRKIVQEHVARGRVELYVGRSVSGNDRPPIELDADLARAYVEEWRRLKRTLRLAGD
ncbi:MAG TPA: YicC/YloC family endoribonuclease, partial [Candidatus Binatia bacterium]|nr:YicC/YloC family endoribonuclease [Candidatus Binatia bacterium]